jgi:hypothetical protein
MADLVDRGVRVVAVRHVCVSDGSLLGAEDRGVDSRELCPLLGGEAQVFGRRVEVALVRVDLVLAGGRDGIAVVSGPRARIGDPVALVGRTLARIGDPVALVGRTLARIGDPVALVGRTLARIDDPVDEAARGLAAIAESLLRRGEPHGRLAFVRGMGALQRRGRLVDHLGVAVHRRRPQMEAGGDPIGCQPLVVFGRGAGVSEAPARLLGKPRGAVRVREMGIGASATHDVGQYRCGP